MRLGHPGANHKAPGFRIDWILYSKGKGSDFNYVMVSMVAASPAV
jgi:hypothetical protein